VGVHEVGQQRAGTAAAHELEKNQEIVGRVAHVGLKAPEVATRADVHLTLARPGLPARPRRAGQPRERNATAPRQRVRHGQYEPDRLVEQLLAHEVGVPRAGEAAVFVAHHHVEML
jgi:hypothetical protein